MFCPPLSTPPAIASGEAWSLITAILLAMALLSEKAWQSRCCARFRFHLQARGDEGGKNGVAFTARGMPLLAVRCCAADPQCKRYSAARFETACPANTVYGQPQGLAAVFSRSAA